MMTGEELFLAEDDENGQVVLSDDPSDRLAQWTLMPFDDDSDTGMRYDESSLVNVKSGKIFTAVQSNRDPQAADNSTACFDLQMIDPSAEHESDVFVLHALGVGTTAQKWLQGFKQGRGLDGMAFPSR